MTDAAGPLGPRAARRLLLLALGLVVVLFAPSVANDFEQAAAQRRLDPRLAAKLK